MAVTTVSATAQPRRAEGDAPHRSYAAEPRWPLVTVVLAATGIVAGLMWDISWHRSIGRDTLFSPPHLLLYVSGVVAGLTCGYLVLRTTFAGSDVQRGSAVRFWGFRGPLGAWVCIWGTFAMLVSAPFDDWWHNAYGLDVMIISPPHIVLLAGMLAVIAGAMLMTLAAQNRVGRTDGPEAWLFGAAAGIAVLMVANASLEYTGFAQYWRGSLFLKVAAGAFPVILVAAGRAGRLRWPATTAAAAYAGMVILAAWILQLVPATPMLPPINNPLTRMVPPPFPMLLVGPALVIDLLLRRWTGPGWRDWLLAGVIGVVFVAATAAIHWPFAAFLVSPAADNFIFFAGKWDYMVDPSSPGLRQFWTLDRGPDGEWSAAMYARGAGIAMLWAAGSARVGLWAGDWMRRVQR